jgi:hypothetical protein
MNDIQNIITESVDDVPLLLEQMKRMELPTLIDQHFPAHGNWYGPVVLRCGQIGSALPEQFSR